MGPSISPYGLRIIGSARLAVYFDEGISAFEQTAVGVAAGEGRDVVGSVKKVLGRIDKGGGARENGGRGWKRTTAIEWKKRAVGQKRRAVGRKSAVEQGLYYDDHDQGDDEVVRPHRGFWERMVKKNLASWEQLQFFS